MSFNYMVTITVCSDFGAHENKVCHCFHFFPIYLPWTDGTGCQGLIFQMVSFKPAFSLSLASGPISSWEIDGETVKTVSDFIFLGSKTTAVGDCSHYIKRRLFLGRTVMTNLDSILKSKDITLPTKVHLVKAMIFSVIIYGCESWTLKKAEHQRIDAFELCGTREDSWESLGLQGNQTSPS